VKLESHSQSSSEHEHNMEEIGRSNYSPLKHFEFWKLIWKYYKILKILYLLTTNVCYFFAQNAFIFPGLPISVVTVQIIRSLMSRTLSLMQSRKIQPHSKPSILRIFPINHKICRNCAWIVLNIIDLHQLIAKNQKSN